MKKTFPTFALAVLIIGIVWLLNELKVIQIQIPIVPIIVVLVGLGLLYNHYKN